MDALLLTKYYVIKNAALMLNFYGTQRIEAWWGQLRKNAADWWIKYFKVIIKQLLSTFKYVVIYLKGLRDEGEFNDSNAVHM